MPPHPLKNFEIQKHYQNEPKFNGFYSINNLPKVKNGTYVIKLDGYKGKGTHWIALYVNAKSIVHFDSFGIEHIPKKIKKFIRNKNIVRNIYRIQAYHSIMCGYSCIRFIDFMLKGKSFLDYTNLFPPNDKIILKDFQ